MSPPSECQQWSGSGQWFQPQFQQSTKNPLAAKTCQLKGRKSKDGNHRDKTSMLQALQEQQNVCHNNYPRDNAAMCGMNVDVLLL